MDGAILRVVRHCAIQRKNRRVVDATVHEQTLDPSNLARARKEHENVAGVAAKGVNDRGGNGAFDRQRRFCVRVAGLDREHSPFARDDRRIPEQSRDRLTVERRGHHNDAKVVAQ